MESGKEQFFLITFTARSDYLFTKFKQDYLAAATSDPEVFYENEGALFNQMQDLGLRLENSWNFSEGQRLDFGYQFTDKTVDLHYSSKEPDSAAVEHISERFAGNIHTLYFDYAYTEPAQFSLDFGLRSSASPTLPQVYWEPRFNFDMLLTKQLHFKAGIGRYLQFVRRMIQYNDLGFGESLWIMANEKFRLPPVVSSQFTAGLWLDKKGFLLDVELYQKKIENLTSLNLIFNNRSNEPFSMGIADIQGLDILLKKKWKHYSSWLSYTLSQVTYQFPEINDGQLFPATHDQLHTINWTHLLEINAWNISLSWNYGSGRPYTGVQDVAINTNGNPVVNLAPRNARRLPPYHRLDMSAHYEWYTNGTHGKIGLSVFNLYDRRNLFDKQFFVVTPDQAPSNAELLQIDRQLLGFTPNLFLEFTW